MQELLTIKEASVWATSYLKKEVTTSNISYLIQYGRITKVEEKILHRELNFYVMIVTD